MGIYFYRFLSDIVVLPGFMYRNSDLSGSEVIVEMVKRTKRDRTLEDTDNRPTSPGR